MTPAPAHGRPTKVVEISGRKIRVTQAPPREAARLAFQLFRSVGRPLVSLLAGGALTIPHPDPDQPDLRVGLAEAWKSPPQRAFLLGEIAERAQSVDDSIIDTLVSGLLVGKSEVNDGEGWVPLTDLDDIDAAIGDFRSMLNVIAAALEVTVLPFASASRTSGDSSPART